MVQSVFLLVLQRPQGYCVTAISSPSPSGRTYCQHWSIREENSWVREVDGTSLCESAFERSERDIVLYIMSVCFEKSLECAYKGWNFCRERLHRELVFAYLSFPTILNCGTSFISKHSSRRYETEAGPSKTLRGNPSVRFDGQILTTHCRLQEANPHSWVSSERIAPWSTATSISKNWKHMT